MRVVFPSVEIARSLTPYFIDETGIGPWLETSDPNLLKQGRIWESVRSAIHLPSVEKDGRAILADRLEVLVFDARALGLDSLSKAVGYWTLSTTGKLQIEDVQILWSEKPVNGDAVRALGLKALGELNQDAVAIEIRGVVEHLR